MKTKYEYEMKFAGQTWFVSAFGYIGDQFYYWIFNVEGKNYIVPAIACE